MTNHKIQFVGSPCGHHGTYTFYKAFKYTLHGKQKILALGEFFFVKIWEEEDIISIGEAQLLWEDRASGQILVSLRMYFLPENTPDGRTDEHGQHEVVSLAEKVVLRAEDVINIMRAAGGVKWDTGLKGVYGPGNSEDGQTSLDSHTYTSPMALALDIKEVMREKQLIGDVIEPSSLNVIVLSYDKYCRIRALLKRLEDVEEDYMKSKIVVALGGFLVPSKKTRLLFCRDVFEYPELEGHELLCNHLAPKLQGRPRKKHKKRKDSESESSEESPQLEEMKPKHKGKPGLLSNKPHSLRAMDKKSNSNSSSHHSRTSSLSLSKNDFATPAMNRLMEVDFMSKLHKFMKDRNSPITRLPHVGYRQLNLFELFTRVQQKGGYDKMMERKLWKQLHEDMVDCHPPGNSSSPSISNAAMLRKNYERLLLPYERYLVHEQNRLYNFAGLNKNNKMMKNEKECISILGQYNTSNNNSHSSKSNSGGSMPQVTVIPSTGGVACTNDTPSSSPGTHISSSPSPSLGDHTPPPDLMNPKTQSKKEAHIPADLAKRPEITITPIPRASAALSPESLSASLPLNLQSSLASCLPGFQDSTGLKIADLMNTLDASLKNSLNLAGVSSLSALENLAKYAERYDKIGHEPAPKKIKTDDSPHRVNGANQRNSGNGETKSMRVSDPSGTKSGLPVPGLVPADILRSMHFLEGNNLLLPAHQSTKTTINTLAALLPQTSIFPASAPAAHQQSKSTVKSQPNSSRLEPPRVHQPQSVYSQSKNIYGKPSSLIGDNYSTKDKRSSPEIEILDLSTPSKRPELELLDLSTRRDLTVSAVPRPSTSRNSNSSKVPSVQVSIKSTDAINRSSFANSPSTPGNTKNSSSATTPITSQAAMAAAAAAQGLSPLGLGLGNPLVPYMLPPHPSMNSMKPGGGHPSSGPGSMMFPHYMDSSAIAAYYSLMSSAGLVPPTSSAGALGGSAAVLGGSAAVAAAVAQQASAVQVAQLSSLGHGGGLPNITPEMLATLGMYKNFLPQGGLPAPHFLSDLMSQNGPNPPSSK